MQRRAFMGEVPLERTECRRRRTGVRRVRADDPATWGPGVVKINGPEPALAAMTAPGRGGDGHRRIEGQRNDQLGGARVWPCLGSRRKLWGERGLHLEVA